MHRHRRPATSLGRIGRAHAAKVLLITEVVAVVSLLAVLLTHGSSYVPRNVGQVPAAAVPAATKANHRSAPLGTGQSHGNTTPASSGAAKRDSTRHTIGRTPTHLSLPAVGIDAQVEPVSVDSVGGLAVPSNVDHLGWWSSGAAPGSSSGTVVIDGHVDSAVQGTGEFFYLEKSTPGNIVVLSTSHGDVRYRVVARTAYKKADLPRGIFSLTGRPRLILITCGGSFDRATRHYADNVVVYALPI